MARGDERGAGRRADNAAKTDALFAKTVKPEEAFAGPPDDFRVIDYAIYMLRRTAEEFSLLDTITKDKSDTYRYKSLAYELIAQKLEADPTAIVTPEFPDKTYIDLVMILLHQIANLMAQNRQDQPVNSPAQRELSEYFDRRFHAAVRMIEALGRAPFGALGKVIGEIDARASENPWQRRPSSGTPDE